MSHENALPAAVRRQIETADAILAEMKKAEESTDESATPPADPPATPPKDQGTTSPAQPATPPATPPANPEETDAQRFKVLQGKYNAEVPRLHRALKEEQNKNAELRQRLTNVESLVASLQHRNKQPTEPAPSPLTDEEIAQFGPDLIDIIRRVAKQETGVLLDKSLKPVQQTVTQVKETVDRKNKTDAELARERLFEELFKWNADWQTQNDSPQFNEWLDEVDPYSGEQRRALLGQAYEANNYKRVIAIFEGFRKEHAVVTPDPNPPAPANDPPADPPTPPKQEGQTKLDELVAPGTPKTGATGAQEESGKRVWTQKEIGAFYTRKNEFIKKNPEKDLPEELVKLERDLFRAQNEGRIR